MEEEWKPIKGYEGIYEVSDIGNVRNVGHFDSRGWFRKPRLLSQATDKGGYKKVTLCFKGRKGFLTHRLVAEAFIPNPDNLPQVNHIDEDKSKNEAINLEWCTALYNVNYGNRTKKASESRYVKILAIYEDGSETVYNSRKEASEMTGVAPTRISDVIGGTRKTSHGYRFKRLQLTK